MKSKSIFLSLFISLNFISKINSDVLQNIDQISSTVGLFAILNSVDHEKIEKPIECPDKIPGCEVVHYNVETVTKLNLNKAILGSLLFAAGFKNLDLRKLILSLPAMYLLTKANYKFKILNEKIENFSLSEIPDLAFGSIDNAIQAILISLALYVK